VRDGLQKRVKSLLSNPAVLKTGIVKEVRWGLVWRDFILEDGRVIPEHKILGCPQPPVWRKAEEVTQDEREACESRLVSMAEAGLDPREREQSFWRGTEPVSGVHVSQVQASPTSTA